MKNFAFLHGGKAKVLRGRLGEGPRQCIELIGNKSEKERGARKEVKKEGKKQGRKQGKNKLNKELHIATLQAGLCSKCIGIWESFLLNISKYQNNLEAF